MFRASGLIILERNFLDVYPYEKWAGKEVGEYKRDQKFTPDELMMQEGKTTAPPLLTEADLIGLMERHGIGTDATHADHIETIKTRQYVELTTGRRFVPTALGYGLVDGYDEIKQEMTKPDLRAGLERDLQAVCEGRKEAVSVLDEQITLYRDVYKRVFEKLAVLRNKVKDKLDHPPTRGHATGSDHGDSSGDENHDNNAGGRPKQAKAKKPRKPRAPRKQPAGKQQRNRKQQ